jgi:hypothetical protein
MLLCESRECFEGLRFVHFRFNHQTIV